MSVEITPDIGLGLQLAYSATQGGTYTVVAKILTIKNPERSVEEVKIFPADGTLDGVVIPGVHNTSPCQLTVVYSRTQRGVFEAAQLANTIYYWKFTFPTDGSSTQAWQGYVSKLGDVTPVKTDLQSTLDIQPTAGTTYTAGV